jgi:hypothetical protein
MQYVGVEAVMMVLTVFVLIAGGVHFVNNQRNRRVRKARLQTAAARKVDQTKH